MTTTRFGLRSLPTYYKGITFRSRLEARWAIVFDQLGIRWEYEPEAFQIDHYESSFGYLPDFYIPELDCFVEVKGHLTDTEYVRLMQIAQAITAPHGGHGYEGGGKPFIVVGNLGDGDFFPTPNSLFADRGEISCCFACEAFIFHNPGLGFANTSFGDFWDDTDKLSDTPGISIKGRNIRWNADFLCHGLANFGSFRKEEDWGQAMIAGRTARFQDGRHV